MELIGEVVEMGDLDGFPTPTPGLRIESGSRIIEVAGLSREEINALPNLLFKHVVIRIEAAS